MSRIHFVKFLNCHSTYGRRDDSAVDGELDKTQFFPPNLGGNNVFLILQAIHLLKQT